MSRSEAISAFGYDAEDVDREIAADNQRADDLGLIFDSDPRHTEGRRQRRAEQERCRHHANRTAHRLPEGFP
jgi:capsid protein